VSTSTPNNLVTLLLPVSWSVHESNAILSLGAQNWLRKPTEINRRVAQHPTLSRKLLRISVQKQWRFHYLNNFHTHEICGSHNSDHADYYFFEMW